mmetsp:Transcript_132628/g.383435  ORF Transcript_132628/g.383435 Transcript_132628/m.383435 type:complete len:273 (-) Transcript_132628:219-1037(-)
MTMPSMRLCQTSPSKIGPAKPQLMGSGFSGACATSASAGTTAPACARSSSSCAFGLPEEATFMISSSSWRNKPTSQPSTKAPPQVHVRVTSSNPEFTNVKLSGNNKNMVTAIKVPQAKESTTEHMRLLNFAAPGPMKVTKTSDGSEVMAAQPTASHMRPVLSAAPGDSSTGSMFSPRLFRRKWNSFSNSYGKCCVKKAKFPDTSGCKRNKLAHVASLKMRRSGALTPSRVRSPIVMFRQSPAGLFQCSQADASMLGRSPVIWRTKSLMSGSA